MFYKLLILILFTACFKNVSKKPLHSLCENIKESRTCPKGTGELFLPRTYPARAIYIGYSSDEVHQNFLKEVIEKARSNEFTPMVNILIPRVDDDYAYNFFKTYFSNEAYHFINYIPTASDDTVWAQDYMEILFNPKTGFSRIVDLPYYGREGENIPRAIALACQKGLVEQWEYTEENAPGNGDYGGNIEPITTKILTVGNNLSNETFDIVQGLTKQVIVDVNVEWLETGHVDELISTLPLKKNASDCEQALIIASPKLAYDLIEKSDEKLDTFGASFEPYYDEYNKWPDRQKCLLKKNQNLKTCKELKRANLIYQKLIDQSVDALIAQVKEQHSCELKIEKFPQLFVPLKNFKEYGSFEDRAVSLNPNSVNNIFFYPNLMLAKQSFPVFQTEVERILKKFNEFDIYYVNGKFVHELNGGIHCATNVAYACSP
tara:strand:+ start:295673 stop:296971 length:1299 start_codon:yes stop_codon:yes gene_type:complete